MTDDRHSWYSIPLICDRFKLKEVSEVQSRLGQEGWFTAKLLTLKTVAGGALVREGSPVTALSDCFSPLPDSDKVIEILCRADITVTSGPGQGAPGYERKFYSRPSRV